MLVAQDVHMRNPRLRSMGDAFSIRHRPTCQGYTARAFATTRALAEISVAIGLAAGAELACMFV